MTIFDTAGVDLAENPSLALSRAAAHVPAVAWSRATTSILVAVLCAAVSAAFARWQLDRAVVPWDAKNHFYPMFRFLGDALRHGEIPLWNPYHFGGYPAVADPQSLIFTPTMALLAFVAPHASMPMFDAMIFAHLLAGGIGVLGLGRRWAWHPVGALLAALVFMFGGAAASRLQHTGMIISYAFFPLALWSLQAALDRRSLRLAAMAGGLAALMALGRDQVAYLLCIALAGSVFRQSFRAQDALAYLRSRTPVILVAAAVTIAAMAVPILLALQFVRDSNRPGIAYGMAVEGSLDPVNLLTLFAPNVFGSLDRVYDYWGPGAATAAGNDWTDRSIDYLFAGTLPVVLLVWHGLVGSRALERGARFFVLLTLGALLYAVGRHTPFFSAAFDWVPGVSLYRRPADATFIANIGLAFLGGYLLHRFIEDGIPRLQATFAAVASTSVALLGGGLIVGSGLAFAWHTGHLDASLECLLVAGAVASVMVTALFLCRAPRWRPMIAAVLVTATAAQLIWRNAASPLNAESASTYSAFDGLYPDQARGLAVLEAELAVRKARGEHPRVEILGIDGSWQNASMVFKLEDTVGYNPLRIAAYERAVGVAESANDPKLRTFPNTFRGYNSRLAALLGLEYLVIDRPIAELPRHIPRPRGTLLFAGNRFYVYRLDTSVAPRVYLATHVQPVDSSAAIDDGVLPPFEVGRDALIDNEDLKRLSSKALLDPAPATGASSAVIDTYTDDQVTVTVDAAAPGVLVLHDLAYPGWRARVDGVRAPMLHANLLFRGVEVPAGHHTVQFSFHPLSLDNLKTAAEEILRKDKK